MQSSTKTLKQAWIYFIVHKNEITGVMKYTAFIMAPEEMSCSQCKIFVCPFSCATNPTSSNSGSNFVLVDVGVSLPPRNCCSNNGVLIGPLCIIYYTCLKVFVNRKRKIRFIKLFACIILLNLCITSNLPFVKRLLISSYNKGIEITPTLPKYKYK